jgi:ABC-type transporter Mla maintaining outer membrane lipid asymmetry ATPase subunit MlaF
MDPPEKATLLIGASGTGKTTLGLNFLAQATPDEPTLHFGFYETPRRAGQQPPALLREHGTCAGGHRPAGGCAPVVRSRVA